MKPEGAELAVSALDLFTDAMQRLQQGMDRLMTAILLTPRPVTDAEWATDWYRDPGAAWWEA